MKKLLALSFLGLFLGFISSTASAQQREALEFYYGATCPHCHEEMKWFPELQELYPDLEIEQYEVWMNATNKKRMDDRLAALNKKSHGVPTNIIDDAVVIGFKKQEILDVLNQKYGPPVQKKEISKTPSTEKTKNENGWKKHLSLSWPAMSFTLGLIDGFNPCAMWSLLILISFLISMENTRRRWWIGGIFIGSSGIIYFSALLAYLYGFSEISSFVAGSIMQWIFKAVGALAIITGGISLRAWHKAEVDCTVRDGESKKKFSKKMHDVLARENFWLVVVGIIGLAFSVNAIELLCSFAIPTTFTATLLQLGINFWEQITAISIYTFAYILDDLAVFLIAMKTLSLTVFSPKIVRFSHLAGGIILVILGIVLVIKPEWLALLGS